MARHDDGLEAVEPVQRRRALGLSPRRALCISYRGRQARPEAARAGDGDGDGVGVPEARARGDAERAWTPGEICGLSHVSVSRTRCLT
jgi:hypothetical protein